MTAEPADSLGLEGKIWGNNLSAVRPTRPVKQTRYLLLWIAAGVFAAAVACGDAATPVNTATPVFTPTTVPAPTSSPTPTPTLTNISVVRVDETDFPVELAVEPDERIRGLSGRAALGPGTGMLFVFEIESRFRFWMREMEFPLDIVWIGAGCQVVDISVNVPPPEPGTSLADLPRYSPGVPALYVLEINGGEAEELGLGVGDPVEFREELAGRYGC